MPTYEQPYGSLRVLPVLSTRLCVLLETRSGLAAFMLATSAHAHAPRVDRLRTGMTSWEEGPRQRGPRKSGKIFVEELCAGFFLCAYPPCFIRVAFSAPFLRRGRAQVEDVVQDLTSSGGG